MHGISTCLIPLPLASHWHYIHPPPAEIRAAPIKPLWSSTKCSQHPVPLAGVIQAASADLKHSQQLCIHVSVIITSWSQNRNPQDQLNPKVNHWSCLFNCRAHKENWKNWNFNPLGLFENWKIMKTPAPPARTIPLQPSTLTSDAEIFQLQSLWRLHLDKYL